MTEEERVAEVRERAKLTDEERSTIIQRDTSLWCPTKGEFLDEVGMVIAKAQLDKVLNDPQVLIEHPDQSLPEYRPPLDSTRYDYPRGAHNRAQQAMTSVGFVRVIK